MSAESGDETQAGPMRPHTVQVLKSRAELLRGVLELDEPWTISEFKDAVGWSARHNGTIRKLRGRAIMAETRYIKSETRYMNYYRLTEAARDVLEDLHDPADTMPNCECRWHVPPGSGDRFECKYCGSACTREELEGAR